MSDESMDRLRLWLAWVVSALWLVQTILAHLPRLGYSPDARVDAAFGVVSVYLFGSAIVSRWKNSGKEET